MSKKYKNQNKNIPTNGIEEIDFQENELLEKPIGTRIGQNGIWLGNDRRIYDIRNDLNDLTGKEWIQRTKSVWISERCLEDKEAFNHPAPFLIKDIRKLITLFTKKGMLVLDPFVGSGTTLISAAIEKRNGIGIDLNPGYLELALKRIKSCCSTQENLMLFDVDEIGNDTDKFIPSTIIDIDLKIEREKFWEDVDTNSDNFIVNTKSGFKQALLKGDAKYWISTLPQIDYCVTSPPYHNILRNVGLGVRHDGSQTRQGVEFYSDDPRDLGNQPSYQGFLDNLKSIFVDIFSKLRQNRYCSIIISDFTVDKVETNVHGDLINILNEIGFVFVGTIILVQDSKVLYPFGYPYQFKINHSHQYILNFIKKG